MKFTFLRDLTAAVGISQSLHDGRMPREKHLKALGLRAEQFTALKLR